MEKYFSHNDGTAWEIDGFADYARIGRAQAPGGSHREWANVNELTSSKPEDLERLAGMAVLNGVPVRIEAVP